MSETSYADLPELARHLRSVLADKALGLALDPRLRENERAIPAFVMFSDPTMRETAWKWTRSHLDQLSSAFGERGMATFPAIGNVFCDSAHAEELKSAFGPRAGANPAIKRVLANTVERVALCIAQTEAQAQSAQEFLRKRSSPARTGTRPPARAAP